MKCLNNKKLKNLIQFLILSTLIVWICYFLYCIYGAGTLGQNLSIWELKTKYLHNHRLHSDPANSAGPVSRNVQHKAPMPMIKEKIKKPFIPRDKPKSWIIFICGVLIGLLVAGPLAILGSALNFWLLKIIGSVLFFACWAIAAIMFFVGIISRISGNWKKLEDRNWKDQVW